SHQTSATTASTDHDASAQRQPTASARGAVSAVVATVPTLIAAVYRPVTVETCPGKSRWAIIGTARFAVVMPSPRSTVPANVPGALTAGSPTSAPRSAERTRVPARTRPSATAIAVR